MSKYSSCAQLKYSVVYRSCKLKDLQELEGGGECLAVAVLAANNLWFKKSLKWYSEVALEHSIYSAYQLQYVFCISIALSILHVKSVDFGQLISDPMYANSFLKGEDNWTRHYLARRHSLALLSGSVSASLFLLKTYFYFWVFALWVLLSGLDRRWFLTDSTKQCAEFIVLCLFTIFCCLLFCCVI